MKSIDTEALTSLSERLYPHVVRSSWRRRFMQDAEVEAKNAHVDEDALWQKLSDSLPFAEDEESSTRRLWIGSAFAAAAAVVFLLWPAAPREVPYDGIKGTALEETAQLKTLRFALVMPDGRLQPGEQNMEVALGTPLVFSLESLGVSEESPLPVALTYERLPFAETDTIATIQVAQEKTFVQGETGYIAFTPDEPGAYVIRAREAAVSYDPDVRGNSRDLSIFIRVVPN